MKLIAVMFATATISAFGQLPTPTFSSSRFHAPTVSKWDSSYLSYSTASATCALYRFLRDKVEFATGQPKSGMLTPYYDDEYYPNDPSPEDPDPKGNKEWLYPSGGKENPKLFPKGLRSRFWSLFTQLMEAKELSIQGTTFIGFSDKDSDYASFDEYGYTGVRTSLELEGGAAFPNKLAYQSALDRHADAIYSTTFGYSPTVASGEGWSGTLSEEIGLTGSVLEALEESLSNDWKNIVKDKYYGCAAKAMGALCKNAWYATHGHPKIKVRNRNWATYSEGTVRVEAIGDVIYASVSGVKNYPPQITYTTNEVDSLETVEITLANGSEYEPADGTMTGIHADPGTPAEHPDWAVWSQAGDGMYAANCRFEIVPERLDLDATLQYGSVSLEEIDLGERPAIDFPQSQKEPRNVANIPVAAGGMLEGESIDVKKVYHVSVGDYLMNNYWAGVKRIFEQSEEIAPFVDRAKQRRDNFPKFINRLPSGSEFPHKVKHQTWTKYCIEESEGKWETVGWSTNGIDHITVEGPGFHPIVMRVSPEIEPDGVEYTDGYMTVRIGGAIFSANAECSDECESHLTR